VNEESRVRQQLKDVENETLKYRAMSLEATGELTLIEGETHRQVEELRLALAKEEEQLNARRTELELLEAEEQAPESGKT
jgi:hypothetical protein